VLQIRTEDMDLIAERGIAAHYSGWGLVSGPVHPGISSGRNSKGKVICLNNTVFALRVYICYLIVRYNHARAGLCM
jgi:GTP pyrophosphokinase